MRVSKLQGTKILYGEAPFGWRLNKRRDALERDPREQRIISIAQHLYTSARMSLRAIVVELKTRGIKNRRGHSFSLSRVWEMVHSNGKPPREANKGRRAAA